MADPIVKKITQLTEATSIAADDLIAIVDVSETIAANKTKKAIARLITLYNTAQISDGIITDAKLTNTAIARLGLQNLTDPNADRILFWDESVNALKWLTLGSGLTITDTTININQSAAVVGKSAAQSIPSGTVTNLTWDVEYLKDPVSMHSNTANPERLIAPVTGWYTAKLNCAFYLNSSGFRWVAIRNSAGNMLAVEDRDGSPDTKRYFSLAVNVYLVQNDYVYVNVFQNSGGALNISKESDRHPSFSLEYNRGA